LADVELVQSFGIADADRSCDAGRSCDHPIDLVGLVGGPKLSELAGSKGPVQILGKILRYGSFIGVLK
jgi:hypothetical protein